MKHDKSLTYMPERSRSYHDDPEKTREAFDEEGYYKTGDVGHYTGKHYIIDGRVSTDSEWRTLISPTHPIPPLPL